MTQSKKVPFHCDVSQSVIFPVTRPGLVRQHQVLGGVLLDVVISLNVGHQGGSLILPDLPPLDMVIVVVAVEHVLDGGLGDLPDQCCHE